MGTPASMVSRSVVSSRAAVTEIDMGAKKVAKKPVKKAVKKVAKKPVKKVAKKPVAKKVVAKKVVAKKVNTKKGKAVDIFFGLFGDPDNWTKKRPTGPTRSSVPPQSRCSQAS